jgi:aspartyl-tRNA(Asn)/glutamyl-tRNA(Gln) amidotransferase subunit C
MSVTDRDVLAIAHLARLALPEGTIPGLVNDLSNILDLFTALEQVDTSECQPMAHPLDLTQRLRLDEITETNQRELLMQNAPKQEAGLFLVPQVIEGNE